MDPRALREAFKAHPDVKIVVLAHLYGTPAKLDEITAIVSEHGALLVEDAAESIGAGYKGRETGSFGDFNCISFNGNKINTGSAGGAFLTDSREDADLVRKWSTQSRDSALWYQHTDLGYNYRMSNIIAGIIRGQIPHLDEHIALKRGGYERYREGFKDLPIKMNPYEACAEPNFWLSCMTINPEAMCRETREDLSYSYESEPGKTCPMEILDALNEINAEGRPIWKPMHMQPIFEDCEYFTENGLNSPMSDENGVGPDIFARGVCLPSDIKMTPGEQDVIIEIVRNCF